MKKLMKVLRQADEPDIPCTRAPIYYGIDDVLAAEEEAEREYQRRQSRKTTWIGILAGIFGALLVLAGFPAQGLIILGIGALFFLFTIGQAVVAAVREV